MQSSAVAWHEGRYRDAVEHNERAHRAPREGAGAALQLGPERSDALHMMIESLVATGDFREAAEYAAQARELDLSVGAVYSGWARGLLPAFFLGEWDSAIEMATQLREAWTAADRPPIAALAAAVACAGAIHGYRGDEARRPRLVRLRARASLLRQRRQRSGVLLLESDVDLHRGRLHEAAERVPSAPSETFWWRAIYAATRAEALLRAGDPRGEEALDEAEESIGDHRYARACSCGHAGLRDRRRQGHQARRCRCSRRSSARTRRREPAGSWGAPIARKPRGRSNALGATLPVEPASGRPLGVCPAVLGLAEA